ncbi:acyl carrier protein [Porphyrobacter sp. GA68]|uniref:acyl carrier protein n=1 Tax=Porphyrobacter sp. GA68 TaxID=2883480 RepID=UPI001D185926|nr:acyl carrier protein [Porphyrobacter sp. GA68]
MIVTPAATQVSGTSDEAANLSVSRAEADQGLRQILRDTLQIDAQTVAALQPDSGLFGALPQVDSMAVAHLFTALEDHFTFTVEDDEVDGEMLETYGALLAFVERKLTAG